MNRPLAYFWFLSVLSLCLCVSVVPFSFAHPVPNDNHDRTIAIQLTVEGVVIDYRLEIDESRAALDLPRSELQTVSSPKELRQTFTRYFAPYLANNLVARLDGKEIEFTCERHTHEMLDHLRCDFRFRAAWRLAPGKHAFDFREGNYDQDDFSVLRVTLGTVRGVTLTEVKAPDEMLMARPGSERKPGDGERLRRASATFVISADRSESSETALPTDGKDAETETSEEDSQPRTLLHLLLDTRRGVALLLLMAAGFGAVHALTPGHGKTLVAAYLVGERGTVWHALVLGLVTTLTHTWAVLLVAGLLPWVFPSASPAAVQGVLEMVGGLMVAGLGFWLLLRRLAGGADHIHLGGHSHSHDHGHPHHHEALPPPGWWGVVVLGISGGIVPCVDAIILLGIPVSAQRPWMALPLLLAFSAGLACVLVALGIGVVYARNLAGQRLGHLNRFRALVRALPLISATVITVLGLWLCYDSLHPGTVPSFLR
jgi:ABC-type nickel/cobalt efflux system permease component RcnA